jgi:hypothetical protein
MAETREQRLSDAVIQLHQIARMIEHEIGRGLLSEDIRDCADRLHKVTSYDYVKKS